MDSTAALNARLAELGFDVTLADPRERIPAAPAEAATRALPTISVEGAESDLQVTALLGQGGMGRVMLARQHSLDREVAIKTLHEEASENARASLLSEGTITGHLEHPAIIPVHALGFDADGRPVLVMKRVLGVEWNALLEDPGHEAWEGDRRDRLEAHLDILMQVCNAAHFAHSRGIVHRDIKPHNVLIGRFGEVYLGDWGLAVRVDRDPSPEPLCGTPSYMAPEMVLGGAIDARTDVYLLGATLHRILVGKPRHLGGLPAALASAIDPQPYAYPPSVPAGLAAIANQAMAPDPAGRPASALELKRLIGDHLRHKSSIALAARAAEKLARLRTLVADEAGLGSEASQREVDVVLAEVRFALEEAQREWPENPAARATGAELEAILATRRARAAALERQARELDPRVGGRQRAWGLAALAATGATVSIAALLGCGSCVRPRALFNQSLVPLVVGLLAAIVLRRHLFRTTLNRRATVSGLAVIVGIPLARGLALVTGATVAQMIVTDLLLGTLVCVLSATFLFRWVAWFIPLMLAGAVGAALWPPAAVVLFALATGVTLIGCAALAWRHSG